MNIKSGNLGLICALAVLCPAIALAQPATADDSAAKPSASHWYDSVTGAKLSSVEGSTAMLTLGEDGLTLKVSTADGSSTEKVFEFMNEKLGSVFDAGDKTSAVGVFRQTPRGIEAEYADGHTELLSLNNGGGLTIALSTSGASPMCVKWYPQGHVFAENERKAALAAYASKLGLSAPAKAAPQLNSCAEEPVRSAVTAPAPTRATRSGKLAEAAPRELAPTKPVLVHVSEVHAIDPEMASRAPVPAEIAAAAKVTTLDTPPPPPPAPEAHLIQASAHVPANHGAANCLSIDSDGQNWGFRNACDNSVQFAYCLQNGKDAGTACGTGTATGGVARNGFFALIASSAVIDDSHQFKWVACSGDAGTVTPHLDRSEPPAGRCVRSENS